ncbi:MAG: hypothetical protein JKY49_00670, partial [Cohaesibacteraceae bacterium]|nr:hypothetical protein [Cohaesibacteraceae bacterium]MBL4876939.1 hypothetical protein [Cohaesibacteraceae bacterium]
PDSARHAAIRKTLDQILASRSFSTSPQLSSFLRFIVEHALQGQQEQIKGYTIATQALGRSENFDPQADPIVRVEATRLRRALARFYLESSEDIDIHITIPKGTYVPRFDKNQLDQSANNLTHRKDSHFKAKSGLSKNHFYVAVAASAVIGLLTGAALMFTSSLGTDRSLHPVNNAALSSEALGIYPQIYISDINRHSADEQASLGTTLFSEINIALSKFDNLSITITKTPDTDFELILEPVLINGFFNVSAILVDAQQHNKHWSAYFSTKIAGLNEEEIILATVNKLVVAIAQRSNPMLGLAGLHSSSSAPKFGASLCIQHVQQYFQTGQQIQHAIARMCLRKLSAIKNMPASIHADLALLELDEFRFGVNSEEDGAALERATAALLLAENTGINSARVWQAKARHALATGSHDKAQMAAEQGLIANPLDADMLAQAGAVYLRLGESKKAHNYLNSALRLNSAPPDWYYWELFLSHLASDRLEQAEQVGSVLKYEDTTSHHVARLLISTLQDDAEAVQTSTNWLNNSLPSIVVSRKETLTRIFSSASLADTAIAHLDALKNQE